MKPLWAHSFTVYLCSSQFNFIYIPVLTKMSHLIRFSGFKLVWARNVGFMKPIVTYLRNIAVPRTIRSLSIGPEICGNIKMNLIQKLTKIKNNFLTLYVLLLYYFRELLVISIVDLLENFKTNVDPATF